MPEVVIQDAEFGPIRVHVSRKGIREGTMEATRPQVVAGVAADIAEEDIQQAVPIIVEEDHPGGVPGVGKAGLGGDLPEPAAAKVLIAVVPVTDGRDDEVRIAIVIEIGEGGCDGNLILQANACERGDLLEPAVAEVAPELVGAELGEEEQVGTPISIDVGHRHRVPMVVVGGGPVASGVVDDLVSEGDAAFPAAVREPKSVERLELAGFLKLTGGTRLEQHPGAFRPVGLERLAV